MSVLDVLDDPAFEQLPPHDVQAESETLGAFLADAKSTVRGRIMEIIPDARAFFLPVHAALYQAACKLERQQVIIDEPMLRQTMQGIDWAEARSAFADCFEAYFMIENGPRVAEIVREHYRRRWLFQLLRSGSSIAYEAGCDPLAEASIVRDKLNNFIVRAGAGNRGGGAGELDGMLDDTISGARRAIQFPWPMLGQMSKALFPGTVTVFAGTAGDGKSFMLLTSLIDWCMNEIPAAIFMLEGKRKSHLYRGLAILAEDSRVLDDDLLRAGAIPIDRYREEHRATIEMVGKSLFDTTHVEPTFSGIAKWVEQQAAKHRVIVVDPISLAVAGKDRYVQDENFMRAAMDAVERYGSSLILVTHPPKQKSKPGGLVTLDDIAGGAVYVRAAHCVLMLQKLKKAKRYKVNDGYFEQEFDVNRVLRILKSREGKGAGTDLAMDFNPSTFRFQEYGIITGEAEKQEVGHEQ